MKSESNFLISPMPGKVVEVMVKKDDIVSPGDVLLVLDAMKMENILKADSKAQVKEVLVYKGEAVAADQNLINLKQIK